VRRICLFGRRLFAGAIEGAVPPKSARDRAALGPRKFCEKLINPYPSGEARAKGRNGGRSCEDLIEGGMKFVIGDEMVVSYCCIEGATHG
jgi:hypothetical protein